MTDHAADLAARAKARFELIERRRRTPRYRRVLGRFVGAGLLSTNEPVASHRAAIPLADALWAGELEPRIFELLPALLLKKPSFFKDLATLPDDLAHAVRALRRGDASVDFRGIPGKDLARWVPRLGRSGTLPSRLRCFRLTADDSRLLSQLSRALGSTEVDVLRRALRELGGTLLEKSPASELGVPKSAASERVAR